MASAAASGEFHKTFQLLKAALQTDPPSSSEASKRLASVRGALQLALPTLPSYDQRNYDLQIRDLESRLARLRATEKPKQRFAFSRPASSATSSRTSSTPDNSGTSGISTPVPDGLRRSTSSAPAPGDGIGGTISSISGSSLAGPSRQEHTLSNLSHRLVRPPRISPAGAGGTSTPSTSSGNVHPPSAPIGYTLSLESLESCYVDLRPAPQLPPSGADAKAAAAAEAGADPEAAAEAEEEVHRLTTLHVKGLNRSVLVAPVVRGSVMLSDVHDSVIILGGQQFRMHSSSNTAVLLHVASLPVIEHSRGIRFGPYPAFLLTEPDFDWPQGGESPNWSRLPERPSLVPGDLPPHPSTAPALTSTDNAGSPDSTSVTSAKGVETIIRNVLVLLGITKEGDEEGAQHVDTSK
ncbi:hypothetical protein JCM24511_05842 [Saitozyma sp. JCM 24511]|nr:hypothetical protein JCM24511_05842 [Saitozyma sp. JCM 24511]